MKIKYQIYLKKYYKTQCKNKQRKKILCVPFLPFLLKNMGRTEQKNFHFQVLINKKYLNKQTHLCKFLNFVNWKSSVAPH